MMTNTTWLNFHFPFLILFTTSFWFIFYSHILILEKARYTLKWWFKSEMKNTPTPNLGRTTADFQRKGHIHLLIQLPPAEWGLPACWDNRLAHHTHELLRSGWCWRNTAGAYGVVGRILDRRVVVQKGQESSCWSNTEYTLVAEGRLHSSGKLILFFSA